MTDSSPAAGDQDIGAEPGARPRLIHLRTTDMSLDWLLGPQLQSFAAAGFEVIGASASGPHVEHLGELGIRHEPLESLTRSNAITQDGRTFVDLVRLLRRLRPDILHTHNPKPGILGRIAGRIAGVPWIVNTQHGLYAQPGDRRRRRWPVHAAEWLAAAIMSTARRSVSDARQRVEAGAFTGSRHGGAVPDSQRRRHHREHLGSRLRLRRPWRRHRS